MKTCYLIIAAALLLTQPLQGFAGNPSNIRDTGSSKPVSENKVITLTQDDFVEKVFDFRTAKEWKYKGDKPAIIDFYAEWCGPCKQLAPVLVELQKEYAGKIQIYKIDAEKNRELAAAFGVNAYPTIFFISMDEKPAGVRGLLPKEKLEEIIESHLKIKKNEK